MQTKLSHEFQENSVIKNFQQVLTKCVHCGYCSATCPTYQLTGDELDSPRGRIYQIKRMLEGETNLNSTQKHLDRCLSCRNCETTCPSGVSYHLLLDFAKDNLANKNLRMADAKFIRWGLRKFLLSPIFHILYRFAKLFQVILPKKLAKLLGKNPPLPQQNKLFSAQIYSDKIAKTSTTASNNSNNIRQIILLKNCLQQTLRPSVEKACADFFTLMGINTISLKLNSCCGAIEHHLDDKSAAIEQAKRNIDSWWSLIENKQIEAIVITATACTLQIKEYPHLFENDPVYFTKAQQISKLIRDPCEFLPEFAELYQKECSSQNNSVKYVLHPPCTLQHGLKLADTLYQGLKKLSWNVVLAEEAHLCCGSAGTYSILQKDLASNLAKRKVKHLESTNSDIIITANIGCLEHLSSFSDSLIYHWLEALMLQFEKLPQA